MAEPETEQIPETFELHGTSGVLKVRFVAPTSLGIRESVRFSVVRMDEDVAYAAALWRCSSALRQHVRATDKTAQLGRATLDWLLEQGVDYLEVMQAGQIAWLHCVRGLPDRGAAASQAGFSSSVTGSPCHCGACAASISPSWMGSPKFTTTCP